MRTPNYGWRLFTPSRKKTSSNWKKLISACLSTSSISIKTVSAPMASNSTRSTSQPTTKSAIFKKQMGIGCWSDPTTRTTGLIRISVRSVVLNCSRCPSSTLIRSPAAKKNLRNRSISISSRLIFPTSVASAHKSPTSIHSKLKLAWHAHLATNSRRWWIEKQIIWRIVLKQSKCASSVSIMASLCSQTRNVQ